MSPDIIEIPERISLRNPADTDTAIMMTRKLTAMETIAILPLKRSLPAMKSEASMNYFAFMASSLA